MDFGTIAVISKFYDDISVFEVNRTLTNRRKLKDTYKTVRACLKAEKRRENITEDEYKNAVSDIDKAFELAMSFGKDDK